MYCDCGCDVGLLKLEIVASNAQVQNHMGPTIPESPSTELWALFTAELGPVGLGLSAYVFFCVFGR